ncbi:MAG: aldo/keto reductase [Bacteroidota bacterium]
MPSSHLTSKIGLGTAAIGRPHYINIRQETPDQFDLPSFRKKGIEVLEEAYTQGIRYFDTAPGYGIAEEMLINWANTKNDDNIEIATKWGYTYTANFDPNASVHEVKEHSLMKLNEQWEQSHKLLPKLTTYQIHSATFDTGVLENNGVLNRLGELKAKYGIHIGLSASGTQQAAILKAASEVTYDDQPLFTAFQVTFNMLEQSVLDSANKLRNEGKRIIIKEALGNGRVFSNQRFPHYNVLYELLEQLANKYNVGIDAIALRYCLDYLDPYVVLSGAVNHEHIIQNLKANNFKLLKSEVEELSSFGRTTEDYWSERKQLAWN